MKIVIYARVSSEKQEDEKTIDSQITELENLVKLDGHVLIDKYIDNGYSGTLLARPSLDRLRDDASKGLFEAVLIHSPDRLARRYVYQEIVIEELKNKGVQVIFKNRRIAETPEDQLLLGVQGIIAEYERAKLVERTRRGRLHKAKSNHIIGNIPPYGYDLVKKNESETGFAYYKVNRDEAKTVNLMFDLLVNKQMTLYGIIIKLNQLQIKPRRGQRWMKSSVHKILRNETYIGITHYNKHFSLPSKRKLNVGKYLRRKNNSLRFRPKTEWIPISNIPVLIDKMTFVRAQSQLELNANYAKRNTKLAYLLRGLIKCNIDRKSYVGVPMHSKPYYRCSGKSRLISDIPCTSRSISARIIEPLVWSTVKDLLHNPKIIIDQLKKRVRCKALNNINRESELRLFETQNLLLKNEENRLLKAYSSGALTLDQLKMQNTRLLDEMKRIEIEKQKLISAKYDTSLTQKTLLDLRIYFNNFRKTIEDLDFEKKQTIVRTILKEIVIDNQKIIMRGILPVNPNAQYNLSSQPPP